MAAATAKRMEAEAAERRRREEARRKAEEEARSIRAMMNRKNGVLTAKKVKPAEKPAEAPKAAEQKPAAKDDKAKKTARPQRPAAEPQQNAGDGRKGHPSDRKKGGKGGSDRFGDEGSASPHDQDAR